MKFNQVTVLAAAALLIPLGGTLASLNTPQATALVDTRLNAQVTPDSTQVAPDSEAGNPLMAKHHRGGGKRHRRGRKIKDLEAIGVDQARLAQIKEIMNEAKEDRQELRQDLRAARKKMHELSGSDASNSELKAHYKKMKKLRIKAMDRRFETKLKIRELLTVEERQKLIELRQQRRGRHHRRHHGPRGPQS